MPKDPYIEKVRNIGISAHIDSGKTTLTERILFYSGRIKEYHDVKGSDGVGAFMDSMELERQKGITIKSAATYLRWGENHLNVIDTPGHVDFTIEVERSLRVLDGAVFVFCGVAGVQSQSITVDKQMRRYKVPRIAFVNKLDRLGATPWKPVDGMRKILRQNCAALQIPIGAEANFTGVVDLVNMKAIYFEGDVGQHLREDEIPSNLAEMAKAKRRELIERVAEVDDQLADVFLADEDPTAEQLKAAVRRATLSLGFVPVLMGSAYKNKGVQLLLNAVVDYLPTPYEVDNFALDLEKNEEKVLLLPDPKKPLVALAFKLEEGQFGQLTFMRVYQGTLKKGDVITDVSTGNRVKLGRVARMHSNQIEAVDSVGAGEIAAISGVDCASGTTFVTGNQKLTLTSMHVPEPVISLAIKPKMTADNNKFSKALNRFQREDPTFRCHQDPESQETVISGMGELHLDIYRERIKREYNCETVVGPPQVNYRETITRRATFDYTHKKQSGGSGQYGKVQGYIEPLEEGHPDRWGFEFRNDCVGMNIPPEFYPAIEKGFREAVVKGPLANFPVIGVRVVLTDGGAHPVDSNELAFRLAANYAFAEAFPEAGGQLLEPVMNVEVETPLEFQAGVVGQLNRRRGLILDVESNPDSGFCVIRAEVPLSKMFGYSTDLRSATEGKGEFTMTYKEHAPASSEDQMAVIAEFEKKRAEKHK